MGWARRGVLRAQARARRAPYGHYHDVTFMLPGSSRRFAKRVRVPDTDDPQAFAFSSGQLPPSATILGLRRGPGY